MLDHKRLTRRQLLRLGAGSLLAAGLWPGALRADGEGTSGDFRFLVVNDTHAIDRACFAWLERVVRQMKSHEKIDFCLHLGDVTDHGTKEELAPTRDVFKALGVPVYFVPGNHDYRSQDDRRAYDDVFPKGLNTQFEHRGWQFVGLDSTEGVKYVRTSIQKPTLDFLDATLPKLDARKPTVVFTHFPLGPNITQRPTNAEAVLERFKKHNLRAVFSGHFHSLTERKVGEVVLTTNRCCSLKKNNHDSSKEKGYFLCQAKDGQVTHTFVAVKA